MSLTFISYEERSRYIDQISEKHVQSTSFETFAENIFNPCRACKNKTLDVEDGALMRTFSLPNRPATTSDPSAMLKLLETQQERSHRNRTSSAIDKPRESKLKRYFDSESLYKGFYSVPNIHYETATLFPTQ